MLMLETLVVEFCTSLPASNIHILLRMLQKLKFFRFEDEIAEYTCWN